MIHFDGRYFEDAGDLYLAGFNAGMKAGERTCTMSFEFEGCEDYRNEELYPVDSVMCSSCESIIPYVMAMKYCPKCGARVSEVD